MNIQEIHDKAKMIINSYFKLNTPAGGILSLNGLNIKNLEDKIIMEIKRCISVEFYKSLDPNLYFMNAFGCNSPKDVSVQSSYQESQTYLEIIYLIRDNITTKAIDVEIEFDFIIKDDKSCCYQYKATAKTINNRRSYSYGLKYIKMDKPNMYISDSDREYYVDGKDRSYNDIDLTILDTVPFIGILNNDSIGNIKIGHIYRSNHSDSKAKDYILSDPRGAFPNILIGRNDKNYTNKIDHLKIGISHIALYFYNIEEIKNLELTFDSTDENRENPIFKEYINYRLKTDYIQDITNIAFNINIWNLEIAFSDYQLIKHHKLFTILAFNFYKKYLDSFLKKPYDKLYIKDKINLYSALLQQAITIEQKITLHRYVAYYSSRLDWRKRFIFFITEDYNKITHPLIGMGICVLITTIINTLNIKFDVIGITNITDIFKYRFACSWSGVFTFLSMSITTIFGYLLYALSIAIKRRFGMGNPKDM